jgi:hypothetical protein
MNNRHMTAGMKFISQGKDIMSTLTEEPIVSNFKVNNITASARGEGNETLHGQMRFKDGAWRCVSVEVEGAHSFERGESYVIPPERFINLGQRRYALTPEGPAA